MQANSQQIEAIYAAMQAGDLPGLPAPLNVSPWLAAALLQKSVRRGELQQALNAASTLLATEPERLWRRCAGMVIEDIGLANLPLVETVTLLAASKRLRSRLGSEQQVAAFVTRAMCASRKCRATDDLLICAARHPSLATTRLEFAKATTAELITKVKAEEQVLTQAAAIVSNLNAKSYRAGGTGQRATILALFEFYTEPGGAGPVITRAEAAYRKTGELLPVMLCLLAQHRPATAGSSNDPMPPVQMIGHVPSWAYDMFSREGKIALAAFLETECETAKYVRAHVPRAFRVNFYGHVLFRIEGRLCVNLVHWELGDTLRRLVDIECHAPYCRDATALLGLARADVPVLNSVRAKQWQA